MIERLFRLIKPGTRQQMVCFHHAGGSAEYFLPWKTDLPPDTALYAIQLPGHGGRINESLLHNLHQMADVIAQSYVYLPVRDTFFFGHSMGAALVSPLLVDMGVSLEQIALLAGGVLIISYIVGAILSGVLHRWFSSPQLTVFGLLGSMLCWLGMTLSLSFSAHNSLPVFVFFILEGFFFNLCCVSIFAWFMCWSEGDEDQGIVQPGTDFTLLQCCEVLGGSIAMVLSGTLAYYLGFTYAFGIATVCAFLVVLLTLYCFRRSQSAYAGFQKDRHTVEIG